MNELEQRLRDEARSMRTTADAGLAARIIAGLPAQAAPLPRAAFRWPAMVAVAALVLIAIAAFALRQDPPIAPQPSLPAAMVSLPIAPSLEQLLAPARSAMPSTAMPGEITALQSDLAVIVRTVRGAVPF